MQDKTGIVTQNIVPIKICESAYNILLWYNVCSFVLSIPEFFFGSDKVTHRHQ
jgi:hypothetical protein